jgi:hypothetical protein
MTKRKKEKERRRNEKAPANIISIGIHNTADTGCGPLY